MTKEQLVEALSEYVIPELEVQAIEELARGEKRQFNVDLDILLVVPLSRLKKQGAEYFGAHPVHGSKTGHNFWVNPSKNVWHCFRHGTGGGPLSWLAVEEGIIKCEETGPRALRGDLFKKAKQKAEERGLIPKTQPKRVEETLEDKGIKAPTILWTKNHSVHPSLDFINEEAFVTVPLMIQKKIDNKRGEEVTKKVKRPIVITSSRKYFEADLEFFKELNLDVEKLPIVPGLRWSRQSIKEYLEGEILVDKLEVFKEILNSYRMFIDFPEAETYNFVSLWTLGTYFFPLFETFPYVYFGGLKRSGKTKTLTLTSLIAFNATFSSNITSSSLFRLIENARSTLLIDETEGLDNPSRRQDFRSILLSGYKKGSQVYRTHKDKHVPEGFGVYSPKMIANIRGLEDVLEDRCITFILLRTNNREIGNREVKTQDPKWQEIRDKLYLLALTSFKEIREIYESLMNETSLSDRSWELWKPILALAKWIGDLGLYEEMVPLALRKSEEKRVENVTETGEILLVTTLLEMVKTPDYYKVKNIRDSMAEKYDEEQKWLNTKWVGRALGRLGFKDKRRVGRGVEYRLSRDVILNLAERLALNPRVVCEVSEVSGVLGDTIIERENAHPTYSQTTRTTHTSPISNPEPLLGDLIPRLRRSFSRGEFYTEDVWINWFQNQGYSQEKAEAYFNELKGKDFFYGERGWALG